MAGAEGLCEVYRVFASELQADLASDEAGALREIAPEVDEIVARIDALLKQLAA